MFWKNDQLHTAVYFDSERKSLIKVHRHWGVGQFSYYTLFGVDMAVTSTHKRPRPHCIQRTYNKMNVLLEYIGKFVKYVYLHIHTEYYLYSGAILSNQPYNCFARMF